ncbi:MAG: cytochrome c biogenesis protein CcsA [Acidimicrobiales bacterium]
MALGTAGIWLAVLAGLGVSIASVTRRWRFAAPCALLGAVAASASMIRLGVAFLGEDWRYEYIADHTRSGIAPLPRLAGLWAGPEGSLLLWGTLVAWAVVVALSAAKGEAIRRWVGGLGGALVVGYLGVVALVASPFDRLDIPAVDGLGLQPILEHPAMVWHPPLLYAGLVGLLVPSLAVVSSAWSGQSAHVPVRRWTIPLGLLAAGLLSGARWAHAELGWGGYWAWDPIESAGLAAWLAGVAALHLQRRPTPVPERALVAIGVLPGLGAIWATTLTRIGVVSSVHAFADRPALRISLLTVAGATSLAFVGAVVVVRPLDDAESSGPPFAQHQHRRVGGWILLVAALYVAAGTYQPLVEAATTGDRLAIAGTYFARILWPVAILGGAAAVRADRRWWAALVGAAIGCIAIPLDAGVYGLALGGIGGAVAGSAVSLVRRRRPGAVAHVGAGLVLVGIAGTLATSVTAVRLVVDEPRSIDGLTLIHRSVGIDRSDVTSTATARIDVDGSSLTPSLVTYHLRGVTTAEVAHRTRGLDELQVVLLDADGSSARYRVNRFPRIHLVWIGGGLVALGLVGAQSRRRLRASSWFTVDPSPSAVSVGEGAAATGGAVG